MTTIQWTDEVWNPVTGCTRVSEGCRHCYIERTPPFRMAGRKFVNGTTGIKLHPDRLVQPLKWRKPRRVFVNSLSDLFHEDNPAEFLTAIFGVMMACPLHTFQILTKRPQRMFDYLFNLDRLGGLGPYIRSIRIDGDRKIPKFFDAVAITETVRGKVRRAIDDPWMTIFNAAACTMTRRPLTNVHLGVSVENQEAADERIPILLPTPAAVRWLSVEPLLAPVDLSLYLAGPRRLHWVVVGGESGPGARPCDISWIRSIVQQCQAADVPIFVKQLGSYVLEGPVGRGGPVTAQRCWKPKDKKAGT